MPTPLSTPPNATPARARTSRHPGWSVSSSIHSRSLRLACLVLHGHTPAAHNARTDKDERHEGEYHAKEQARDEGEALARAGVSDSLMSFTAPFNFINPKSGERTVPNFDVLGHAVVNEEPSVGVAVEFVDAFMVHHQNVYLVPRATPV